MKDKIYFPGLNGLRFLAAFVVIIHHVEEVKYCRNLPNCFLNIVIARFGPFAVALFFVLSAFLITYLLLAEYGQTKTIHIKEFYWRRILRIWPLYYLIVALAFFVVPFFVKNDVFFQRHFLALLAAHMVLLPSVVFIPPIFTVFIYGAQQLWSIGIEEQFYLVWPILTKFFIKDFCKMLLFIIVLKLAFHHWGPSVLSFLETKGFSEKNIRYGRIFYLMFDMIPFEKMGVGALGAFIVFNKKEKFLKFIFHPFTEVLTWAAILVLFLSPEYKFLNVVQGALFTLLIMNVACNPKRLLNLENKYFNYLGKISYGIYMVHSLVIMIAVLFLEKIMPSRGFFFNGMLYLSSICLSVAVAALSYRYFESYFLKLKKKAQIVISGG